eukprot:TRINITY_DN9141_c0_g1_i1.p1 TRINITY_DN9141_c0_g1~~TRINITY_DN9141_c0_g1_i1.p1  ORF type:complete len:507 (-),score=90.01 TRINITY_DN9141_c0_g1_i1:9-1529(-)
MTLDRRNDFKQGIDKDQTRRMRQALSLNARKSRRVEGLRKKRNLVFDGEIVDEDIYSVIEGFMKGDVKMAEVCLEKIRRLSSVEYNPPLDAIADRPNVLMKIVAFLETGKTSVQYEAAWCLTNLCAGNSRQTQSVVVIDGSVKQLIKLSASDDKELSKQCIWALGNIAGESIENRDLLLKEGALSALLCAIEKHTGEEELIEHSVWTISNFCRNNPNLNSIASCIPVMANLLETYISIDTLSDIYWAFSYITTDNNDACIEVMKYLNITRLIDVLSGNMKAVIVPVLRTMGNLVSGDSETTLYLINNFEYTRAITKLFQTTEKRNLLKESCWTLSNIATELEAINQFMQYKTLEVLYSRYHSLHTELREEIGFVVANVGLVGEDSHIRYLVECKGLEIYLDLFNSTDDTLVLTLLGALQRIFEAGTRAVTEGAGNPYCLKLEEIDGLSTLEDLQEHRNEEIYTKAIDILESFFSAVPEPEPELPYPQPAFTNWGPTLAGGQMTFSF